MFTIILFCLILYAILIIIYPIVKGNVFKCSRVGYNEPNIFYVHITLSNKKEGRYSYYGVINREDYANWQEGKRVTIWINSILKKNYGHKLWTIEVADMEILDKNINIPIFSLW